MVWGLGRHGGNLNCLLMQVAALEEQKNEATENEGAEKVEDESKLVDADSSAAEPTSKNETFDEKPDINDVPMEENEVKFCSSLHLLHVYLHTNVFFQNVITAAHILYNAYVD